MSKECLIGCPVEPQITRLRKIYEAQIVNDAQFAATNDPDEAEATAHFAADLEHDLEDHLRTLHATPLCPTCPYHDGNKVLADTVGEETLPT